MSNRAHTQTPGTARRSKEKHINRALADRLRALAASWDRRTLTPRDLQEAFTLVEKLDGLPEQTPIGQVIEACGRKTGEQRAIRRCDDG